MIDATAYPALPNEFLDHRLAIEEASPLSRWGGDRILYGRKRLLTLRIL